MKKFTVTVLVIIIALFACVATSADTTNSNIIEIDHVTVIFEENSTFSLEEKILMEKREQR